MNIAYKKSLISTEPAAHRARAIVEGVTIADSADALILHEAGHAPVLYFPLADVVSGMLVPTAHASSCPLKGDANYYSIRLPSGRVVENAVWQYAHPKKGLPELADRVAFYPHLVRLVTGETT
ncbi:MAG: DUF427 domain-containing protein [Geminicoccaceae bacterium]